MKAKQLTEFERLLPDRPAGPVLEELVLAIGGRFAPVKNIHFCKVSDIAGAVRERFRLHGPIQAGLFKLIERCDIELRSVSMPDTADGAVFWSDINGKWEIEYRDSLGLGEAKAILHEFYELLWSRCHYVIPWWGEWVASTQIAHPHNQADSFAFEIQFPPRTFPRIAQQVRFDPYALSQTFSAYPGDCASAIIRRIWFPFPYLQIKYSEPSPSPQESLDFWQSVNLVSVVKKHFKRCGNEPVGSVSGVFDANELIASGTKLPRDNDYIGEAIRSRKPSCFVTRELFGQQLSSDICVVVRPNSRANQTGYIQIVPSSNQNHIWLDAAFAPRATSDPTDPF